MLGFVCQRGNPSPLHPEISGLSAWLSFRTWARALRGRRTVQGARCQSSALGSLEPRPMSGWLKVPLQVRFVAKNELPPHFFSLGTKASFHSLSSNTVFLKRAPGSRAGYGLFVRLDNDCGLIIIIKYFHMVKLSS